MSKRFTPLAPQPSLDQPPQEARTKPLPHLPLPLAEWVPALAFGMMLILA